MANKIKYGLSNVYYAVATDDGTGTLTYDTPVPIKGAVNLTMDPQGDTTPFYADNIIYYTSTANNGYSGTLEIALLPESFRTDVLGEAADSNGVMVETAGVPTVEFALLFQFEGDVDATKHAFFRCTASRPSASSATQEAAINPQTETLNLTAMPRISDKVVKARCLSTSTAQYEAWDNAVYTIAP